MRYRYNLCIQQPERNEAPFAVCVTTVLNSDGHAIKDSLAVCEVNSMLLNIDQPLGFIPLVLMHSVPTIVVALQLEHIVRSAKSHINLTRFVFKVQIVFNVEVLADEWLASLKHELCI
jgi:hypothetical protein